MWNHERSGLVSDSPVAIWDDAGHVVAGATVPEGDESFAVENFRYTPIEPVELPAGKRYVIAALYTPKTKAGTVLGNVNATAAGPIRWVTSRRAQTEELTLPGAEAGDRRALGSFGPNFLIAASDATKKPGTYYRSRSVGSPPKEQIAVVPGATSRPTAAQ